MTTEESATKTKSKSKRYKFFTPEEDAIIKEHFPTMQRGICKMLPDRSIDSIVLRAKALGIEVIKTKIRPGAWTEEEDEILRKNYRAMGSNVRDLLPNRTDGAIDSRVRYLKIKKPTNWTPDEDRVIRNHDFKYTDELLDLLPGRTKHAITARAQYLFNRHQAEVCYPMNLYIAVCGKYNGYDKVYIEFEFMAEKVYAAIRENSINPEIGEKIAKALELKFKDHMDMEDISYEMSITPAQAEDLVNRGIKLMKHFLLKKK